jgi:hypothetical protein
MKTISNFLVDSQIFLGVPLVSRRGWCADGAGEQTPQKLLSRLQLFRSLLGGKSWSLLKNFWSLLVSIKKKFESAQKFLESAQKLLESARQH